MPDEVTAWDSNGMDWSSWETIDPENPDYIRALILAFLERRDATRGYIYSDTLTTYSPSVFIAIFKDYNPILVGSALSSLWQKIRGLFYDSNYFKWFTYNTPRADFSTLNHNAYRESDTPELTFKNAILNSDIDASFPRWNSSNMDGFLPNSEELKKQFYMLYKIMNQMKYLKFNTLESKYINSNYGGYPFRISKWTKVAYQEFDAPGWDDDGTWLDLLSDAIETANGNFESQSFEKTLDSPSYKYHRIAGALAELAITSMDDGPRRTKFQLALINGVFQPYFINYSSRNVSVYFFGQKMSGFCTYLQPIEGFNYSDGETTFNVDLGGAENSEEKVIWGNKFGSTAAQTLANQGAMKSNIYEHPIFNGEFFIFDPTNELRFYPNELGITPPPENITDLGQFAIAEYDCEGGFQFLDT